MDIIDLAQQHELMIREQAIAFARARGVDAVPVYINGRKRCVSCNRPIPLKRLQARPDAVRCVACEEKNEGTGWA